MSIENAVNLLKEILQDNKLAIILLLSSAIIAGGFGGYWLFFFLKTDLLITNLWVVSAIILSLATTIACLSRLFISVFEMISNWRKRRQYRSKIQKLWDGIASKPTKIRLYLNVMFGVGFDLESDVMVRTLMLREKYIKYRPANALRGGRDYELDVIDPVLIDVVSNSNFLTKDQLDNLYYCHKTLKTKDEIKSNSQSLFKAIQMVTATDYDLEKIITELDKMQDYRNW